MSKKPEKPDAKASELRAAFVKEVSEHVEKIDAQLTRGGYEQGSSVGGWGPRFVDFLLGKLSEYQAREGVAPCSELRERIDLVRKMLESFQQPEEFVERTSEASNLLH